MPLGRPPKKGKYLTERRELARLIFSKESSAPDVAEYKLPRTWRYGLDYYFGKELREWTPGSPQPEWIVTTPAAALEIQDSGILTQEADPVSAPTIMLLRVSRPEDKRSLR